MVYEKKLITPQGEIVIRQALPADATQLRELRLEALRDSPQAFGADYQINVERTASWWEENIRAGLENDEQFISIAEINCNLVGLTGIYRRNQPKSFHSGLIWGVFVTPEWRGFHIAETLVENCLDWGREHGVLIARLAVNTTNGAAIRCYLRCGFEIYGVEPMVIHWDGKYFDELLMMRRLDKNSV